MKKLFIIGIVALCLLTLGCFGPSSQTGTFETAPPQQQKAGDEGAGTAGSPQDLTGKGMAALIAIGTPIKCTVTDPTSGQTSTAYIKGSSVRVEYQNPENKDETLVMVSKQGSARVQIPAEEKSEMGGCDWLEMTYEGMPGAPQTAPETGAPSIEGMEGWDPVNFHCEPALFGDEKFETPGKVCSLHDMMCAGITDPQMRAQFNCS